MEKKHHKKKKHHMMMGMPMGAYEDATPMTGMSHEQHEKMEHKKKKKDGKFIQKAIKHPGALREELHVKKGHKIPMAKLEKAEHAKGKEGRRARLAVTLRKLSHKKKGK